MTKKLNFSRALLRQSIQRQLTDARQAGKRGDFSLNLNNEIYGTELYHLLECINLNNPKKSLPIDALLNWAERYINFSSITVCTIQSTTHPSVEINFNRGVPKQWIKEYHNSDYAKDDPVIKYALSIGGMFSWQDALSLFNTPRSREVITRARAYGLHDSHSYCMPTSNRQGKHVKFISLANVSAKSDSSYQYIIATLGATIFYFIDHIANNKYTLKVRLSDEELQALYWAAKGKSMWEISQIISTPERTVKYRLINTYRKLHVSNKTQAVSTALKLGLLD